MIGIQKRKSKIKTTIFIILAILGAAIILIVLLAAFNTYRFKRKVAGEIDAIFACQPQGGWEILMDAEIENLPLPIQKHLYLIKKENLSF